VPHDNIFVYCSVENPQSELGSVLSSLKDYVEQNIKQPLVLSANRLEIGKSVIIEERAEIKGDTLQITLVKRDA